MAKLYERHLVYWIAVSPLLSRLRQRTLELALIMPSQDYVHYHKAECCA